MKRVLDDWMDQTRDMQDATHDDIIMKQRKCNTFWLMKMGGKVTRQEKIIAEAQIKDLKDLNITSQLINKLKQDQKMPKGTTTE